MTPNKPDISLVAKFTTGQAVALLGMTYSTFRNYVKQGRIRQSGVACNGRAYYTGRDLLKGWSDYWKMIYMGGGFFKRGPRP